MELLARLRVEIGTVSDETVEGQSRRVLLHILEPVSRFPEQVPEDPKTCPNCSVVTEGTKSPYCSERCKEIASFVRQFRGNLATGQAFDAEKQTAIGQNYWHLVGGGRPLRQTLVLPRSFELVMELAEYKCQECGADATNVDHLRTGCNRPINLRAVCDDCCRDRPFEDPQVLATKEFSEVTAELAGRIQSPEAVRCCDDPAKWDWRAYIEVRKKALS
jgi:endogenous inhibitor of DNA gyrase (YacG/DUF329 family)